MQKTKRDKIADIINPYHEGFENDAFLEMRYTTVREMIGLEEQIDYSWRVIDAESNSEKMKLLCSDRKKKIKNNIECFRLDEVYKTNSRDFQRIIRIKYINESQAYRNSVSNILDIGKNRRLDMVDEQMLYGVSLDEDKFQDEILAKAIYDIVVNN